MKRLLLPIAIALFAVGCSKEINNKEAVRVGVVDYLQQRQQQTGLDMGLMNVEVSAVTFQKNEARATVAFKPKNGDPSIGGMSMNYVLERRGDKWVVKGRQESGVNPHGGAPTMPGMTPPSGAPPAGGGAMPPNHPPVDGAKPNPK